MADTPDASQSAGETANQGTVSNDVSQISAPTQDNASAEVEKAKKETQQAEMRANQLANQLAEKEKVEQEIQRKQLEEKEEFKKLYEQTNTRLEQYEAERKETERKATLSTATTEVFKDYPEKVVELAQKVGLSLTEDTDEARNSLKEKLDAFKDQVPSPSVNSNNPHEPANNRNASDLTKRNEEGISPMAMAAAKGDLRPQYEYIRELPAIKRMKEISRGA